MNPKTIGLKFLISQTYEAKIPLRNFVGDEGPSEQIIYRNDPLGAPDRFLRSTKVNSRVTFVNGSVNFALLIFFPPTCVKFS